MVWSSSLAAAVDELIRLRHNRTLAGVLREERRKGYSPEHIARRIWLLTNEVVPIHPRTVRRWVEELESVEEVA